MVTARPLSPATEELHAFFNADKRVQIERRQAQLVLRDDDHACAPPRTGIDLDGGTAVIHRQRWPAPGKSPGAGGPSPLPLDNSGDTDRPSRDTPAHG